MLKNLLIISILITAIFNFTNLLAETISKIPLKKPTLTNEEFNEKLSKNILMVAAGFLALVVFGTNYMTDQQTKALWQQEQTLRQEAREQAAVAVYDLGELPTLEVRTPKPVTKPFHIIAGSFRSGANADRLVQTLNQNGYAQATRLPKTASGFYQVSFAAYATQREAYNAKAAIKRNNYPDAWVLKK